MSTAWLKHIYHISLPTAIGLSAVLLCAWTPSFATESTWLVVLTMLLTCANGALLTLINLRTQLSREMLGTPLLLYMLVCAAFTPVHTCWQAQLVTGAMLGVLLLIQNGYRVLSTASDSLRATLYLSLSSLLVPDMVWMIPMIWLMYAILNSLQPRTLLASIIGVALVSLYVAIAHFLGWFAIDGYTSLLQRHWLGMLVTPQETYCQLGIVALGVLFTILTLPRFSRDNTNVQTLCMLFIVTLVSASVLSLLLVNPIKSLFPIVLVSLSGIVSIYLRQSSDVVRGSFFLVYVVACLAVFAAGNLLPLFGLLQ